MGSLSNLLPFFFKTNSRNNELIRTEIPFQFITPGYEIFIIWNQRRKSVLRLKDIQPRICTKTRRTTCTWWFILISSNVFPTLKNTEVGGHQNKFRNTRGLYSISICDVISLHVSMGYGVRGPGSFFVGPPVLEKWNRPASINQVLKHTVRGEGRILPKMDGPKKF